MADKAHWEAIYTTKPADALSWYQSRAERSLAVIRAIAADREAPIIDVGGGTSALVDELLDDGYTDLTVLDVAGAALAISRSRLGERATRVHWLEADVRSGKLPTAHYAVWHDRAVFHFLTATSDQVAYVKQVQQSIRPGVAQCIRSPVRARLERT